MQYFKITNELTAYFIVLSVINNVRCKLLARVFAVVNRKTTFINTYKFAS